MSEVRTATVRFKTGPIGLVQEEEPYHFVEHVALEGEHGEMIVEGDLPVTAPEGWVLVKVGSFYAPVHPKMVEVV